MAEFKYVASPNGYHVFDSRTDEQLGEVSKAETPRGSWDYQSTLDGAGEGNAPTRGEAATALRALYWGVLEAMSSKPRRGRPPVDPSGDSVRIEVILTRAQHEAAKAEAKRLGISVSALIRGAVGHWSRT